MQDYTLDFMYSLPKLNFQIKKNVCCFQTVTWTSVL